METKSDNAQFEQELASLRERLSRLEALEAEHQRVEEALRLSEAKYRALLESASDGIVVVNGDGDITLINSRAQEMFGYARGELLGKPVEMLMPEHLRSSHIEHRGRYMSRPYSRPMGTRSDLVAKHKDGTEFPVDISLGYANVGDEELIVSYIYDISERRRAEEAVRNTLEELQQRNRDLALLNQAGQTLTATLDLNRVVVRLLHAVTETIGAQASSVWLLDPDDPGWLVCQAAFDSGESYSLVDVRLSPGQGIAGWVVEHGESVIVSRAAADPRFSADIDAEIGFHTRSLLAVPLLLRDSVIGVLEVVNKIEREFDQDDQALVETLAASAAIAVENARLVDALRQHADELQKSNDDLDAFAHTVAHDLKGPIGLIIGFAQTLEENFAEIPPKELRRHLRTITRNGRKMNSIIKELLLMSSVRRAEVQREPVDMSAIVAEALDRLSFLIEEFKAEIILPRSWPPASGYGPWLEEVWVNYISNAVKYGGPSPCVELGATPATDDMIRFWVKDHGAGIALQDQQLLFTPFMQLDATAGRLDSPRAQGHGLGLSIVKRIVEKLGGEVGVESHLGQGSTFFFTLSQSD